MTIDEQLWDKGSIATVLGVTTQTIDRWIKHPYKYAGMWFPKPDLKYKHTNRWKHSTMVNWLVAISKRNMK